MIIDKTNINIEFFHNAHNTSTVDKRESLRKQHMQHVLDNNQMIHGEILEFGVFKGKSLRQLSEHFNNQIVYGFDSFEGLPEDWIMTSKEQTKGKIKHKKGHFDTTHIKYNFKENVKLVKGFYDTSLPSWLEDNKITSIKLLHVDCDLYSSTKTIFDNLNSYIVTGTIIVFDELYPWSNYSKYDLWEEGEWRALKEWITDYNRSFKILSRNNHQQAAIEII